MPEEIKKYCQYCVNANLLVSYAPVGSGRCVFGCNLDCYKRVEPFDTCKEWKPRRPREVK